MTPRRFDGTHSTIDWAQELEADRFALNVLQSAVATGTLKSDPAIVAELDVAGLGDDLQPSAQVIASLLFATSQMSVGLLFSRGKLFSSMTTITILALARGFAD